jgi:hypothetical protein
MSKEGENLSLDKGLSKLTFSLLNANNFLVGFRFSIHFKEENLKNFVISLPLLNRNIDVQV